MEVVEAMVIMIILTAYFPLSRLRFQQGQPTRHWSMPVEIPTVRAGITSQRSVCLPLRGPGRGAWIVWIFLSHGLARGVPMQPTNPTPEISTPRSRR